MFQDTVQMQKEAQNNQTQTQATLSNLQPTDLPQEQGDSNARNIDN